MQIPFQTMDFPQYSEPSSALIRMYLGGEFGSRPSDVNAYAASTFYAVDRYASFRKVWGDYYQNGGLMLSNRYATSNAVHQASKVAPEKGGEFFAWLYDFDLHMLELPSAAAPAWTRRIITAGRSLIACRTASSVPLKTFTSRSRSWCSNAWRNKSYGILDSWRGL